METPTLYTVQCTSGHKGCDVQKIFCTYIVWGNKQNNANNLVPTILYITLQ